MTLAPFTYSAPADLAGAVEALGRPGAVPLAGGHHLLTRLRRRELAVDAVVDLRHVEELRGVTRTASGALRIGALTTLTGLLRAPLVRGSSALGALTDAASLTGDRQSRNRVTLGGQLAAQRPADDVSAALLALAAVVHVTGPGGPRTVPVDELWPAGSAGALALESGELVVAVEVPPAAAPSAYARWANRATLEAVCGVAVALGRGPGGAVPNGSVPNGSVPVPNGSVPGGGAARLRIAAVGLTDRPVRLAETERAAGPSAAQADGDGAPVEVADGLDVVEDHLASAEYRRFMTGVLLGRALHAARERGDASS